MRHFFDNTVNQRGTPLPGITVTVFTAGTLTPATIYSDDGVTPKSNPFTTDPIGRYDFYAPDGRYDIQFSGQGITTFTRSSEELADVTEFKPGDSGWATQQVNFNQQATPATPALGTMNVYGKSDDQMYWLDDQGIEHQMGSEQAIIPNTALAFSATPVFDVSKNHSYSMTLTANVTSSSTTGVPKNGQLLSLTLVQDGAGGHTFAFPGNFILPVGFTFDAVALHTNALTFKFDGTNWNLISNSGTGGGGGSPANPNNSIQKNNLGAFGASSITDDGTTVTVAEPLVAGGTATVTGQFTTLADAQFRGNNPYIDVRAFGVRALSSVPSTTGTINSGSPTLTLASASTFINGDGIVVRGAGTTNPLATPSAPTVTASNARVMTGTGITIANSGGATTYQYQIVARTTGGGYTAASSVTSIANGAATLGQNQVSISSWTASGQTITVNTSANHNLVTNAMVLIFGAGNANGFWQVASTPTGTSFTFTTLDDTVLGADTSGGAAGTVQYWACNHITWTEVPNAYQYFIYGRTAGAMNLIGISLPQSSSFGGAITGDPTAAEWDDFGSTMSANIGSGNVPDWVPLTPPGAAKNNDLVTTISSGGGTTTLTLANTASNSVVTQVVKLDNTPNILAAASAATANKSGSNGVLYFPAQPLNTVYSTSSFMDLTQFPQVLPVMMSGQLALGDTMKLGPTQWSGGWPTQPVTQGNFQLWKLPTISTATAFPMIYSANSVTKLDHLTLSHTAPFGVIWVNDKLGGIPSLEVDHVNFSTAGNDYMAMHLIVRGDSSSGANIRLTNIGGNGGGLANNLGITATPYYYFWGCGDPSIFQSWSIARRGFMFGAVNGPGFGAANLNNIYIQGSVMPIITTYINTGILGAGMFIGTLTNDTGNAPTLAAFGSPALSTTIGPNGATSQPTMSSNTGGRHNVRVGGNLDGSGGFFTQRNTVVDSAQGVAIDGSFSTIGTTDYLTSFRNSSTVYGNPYFPFINAGTLPTPSCAVSAGGSVALGTYSFQIVAYYPNGGASNVSPSSNSCTTTGGNQTITITWTTMPGAIGYGLYQNGASFSCGGPWVTPGSATQYVWAGVSPCNVAKPTVPGSGPVGFNANGLWAPNWKVVSTDLGGTATISSASLTANRSQNLPDLGGTFTLSPTISNNVAGNFQPDHLVVGDRHVAGTIIDSGVQLMNVYDDMHHGNAALATANPNWKVAFGSVNVTSNLAVPGSAGTNLAIYNGVSWPSNDQTAIITLGTPGGAGNSVAVATRGASGAATAYICVYAVTGTALSLQKVVANAYTTLAGPVTLPAALGNNDTIQINTTGTNSSCYVNGKQIIAPTSDASIASGTPGMWWFNTGGPQIAAFAASYGSVSLGFAQTWSAIQNFTAGIQLNGSTTLTSVSGNSGRVGQTSGTLTNGNLAKFDASGNVVDSTFAAANFLPDPGSNGLVARTAANTTAARTLQNTSGGALTWTNPGGVAGNPTPAFTFPGKAFILAAGCNNATASPSWDLPTASAPTPNCNTGTNIQEGTLDFADGQSAQFKLPLPSDWTGAIDADLFFFDSSTTGTVIWNIQTACSTTNGSATDDVAFNTADAFPTITLASPANAQWVTTKTGITTTGCSAGNVLQVKISRATDTAVGVARAKGIQLTIRRAL